METSLEFDKLIESIAKQQQQKSDLEIAIQRSEGNGKNLEKELASLQHKQDFLNQQIPELKKMIAAKNVEQVTKSNELVREKSTLANLKKNVEALRCRQSLLEKENAAKLEANRAFVSDAAATYSDIIAKLSDTARN
jgi:peptidoglycan hydrolase CwlO-like protein